MSCSIYVRGGVDSALHAEAYQRVAVAQASQGRWADAMATYEKLRSAVAKDDSSHARRHIDTNLDLAVALLRAGQAQQAIPILDEGVVKNRTGSGAGEYAVAVGNRISRRGACCGLLVMATLRATSDPSFRLC